MKGLTLQKIVVQLQSQQKMLQVPIRVLLHSQPIIFSVSSGSVTIKTGGVSNDELAGSIANEKLSHSKISVTDGTTSSDVNLGGSITFTADEGIAISQDSGTVTISVKTQVRLIKV